MVCWLGSGFSIVLRGPATCTRIDWFGPWHKMFPSLIGNLNCYYLLVCRSGKIWSWAEGAERGSCFCCTLAPAKNTTLIDAFASVFIHGRCYVSFLSFHALDLHHERVVVACHSLNWMKTEHAFFSLKKDNQISMRWLVTTSWLFLG